VYVPAGAAQDRAGGQMSRIERCCRRQVSLGAVQDHELQRMRLVADGCAQIASFRRQPLSASLLLPSQPWGSAHQKRSPTFLLSSRPSHVSLDCPSPGAPDPRRITTADSAPSHAAASGLRSTTWAGLSTTTCSSSQAQSHAPWAACIRPATGEDCMRYRCGPKSQDVSDSLGRWHPQAPYSRG